MGRKFDNLYHALLRLLRKNRKTLLAAAGVRSRLLHALDQLFSELTHAFLFASPLGQLELDAAIASVGVVGGAGVYAYCQQMVATATARSNDI